LYLAGIVLLAAFGVWFQLRIKRHEDESEELKRKEYLLSHHTKE
jgi:hypothetical protein